MRLEEFSELDGPALYETLAEMIAAFSPAVRRVAREYPGLYVRPLEHDLVLVYLLEDDHEVHVGVLNLGSVRRTPPASVN